MPQPTANYTGTHNWDANSILNYVLGQQGTASPGPTPEFLRIGGRFLENAGSATGTLDNILWVDERGYINPHLDNILLFSTTTAGTQTTSTGTTLSGLGAMQALLAIVEVTGTGGASGSLQVFLDSQIGGTRFINIANTGVIGSGAIAGISISRTAIGSLVNTQVGSDAGGGAARGFFGDNIRVRYTIGSNATSQMSFNVYITGIG